MAKLVNNATEVREQIEYDVRIALGILRRELFVKTSKKKLKEFEELERLHDDIMDHEEIEKKTRAAREAGLSARAATRRLGRGD